VAGTPAGACAYGITAGDLDSPLGWRGCTPGVETGEDRPLC